MFNSFHQVQLQKNLKSKLREKFKSTDIAIGPQNDPFRIKEEFLSKKNAGHFLVFIESLHQAKNQKKVMRQS